MVDNVYCAVVQGIRYHKGIPTEIQPAWLLTLLFLWGRVVAQRLDLEVGHFIHWRLQSVSLSFPTFPSLPFSLHPCSNTLSVVVVFLHHLDGLSIFFFQSHLISDQRTFAAAAFLSIIS